MKLMNAKGTRDFLPEDKIIREEVVDRLKTIFKLYGYNPIETPIIERSDILAAKYAGGAEILKESFTLKDQGKRDLMLRYDLTVPFSRFVGMNPNLKMPFKRYQIGRVFRDGPIKLGRYREFWQCDVDVVGSKTMMAEAELLAIADRFFREIGFTVTIKVNNRKVLNSILATCGVTSQQDDVILSLDKLAKIGREGVQKELKEKKIKSKDAGKILDFFEQCTSLKTKERIAFLEKELQDSEGISEVKELFSLIDSLQLNNVVFDVSLARGLSYYTGTVYEVFLNDKKFTSAIAGGGRYDSMISNFLGTKMAFPAVGISFGLEGIIDIMRMSKQDAKKTVVDFYIVPIGNTQREALGIAQQLRENNINVDLDIVGKGISKNLDFANKYGIPFVIFIGDNELKQGKIKVKNMAKGTEKIVSLKKLASELKKL
jgi:histidyl-tRNA synthetase